MAFAALFSGGKDSAYSVYLAQKAGIRVDCLVTMLSENPESYMFHVPNAGFTELHSDALGISLVRKRTKGRKEEELAELKDALVGLDIDGLIVGAVASSYQMNRVERLCKELSLDVFAPLWHRDEETLLRNFVGDGFECVFVACCAEGFGEKWLGRKLDGEAIGDLVLLKLKYGINISGEGGEYETLALDGPNFKKRIEIVDSQKSWKKDSGFMTVKDAKLVEKGSPVAK